MIVLFRRATALVLMAGVLAAPLVERFAALPRDASAAEEPARQMSASPPSRSEPTAEIEGPVPNAASGVMPGAASVPGPAPPPEPRFTWPLSPTPQVTRPFRAPETDYGAGHRGVDLGAVPGQLVLAAGTGVVVFTGQVAGQGVVSVDHDGGLRTTYEPVTPLVAAGTEVSRGQPVATVNPGHPGCPVAACLHWGVRRGDEYLSPLGLIQTESIIRLKPWILEPP